MFKVIKKLGLGRFVILLTIIILYSLAAFIPVKFMQSMIDAVYLDSYQKAIKQILISGTFYVVFQALSQFLYALYNFCGDKYQNEYARDIRNNVFEHILEVNDLKIKAVEKSKLSNGIIEDTQYISENYYRILIDCMVSVVNFVIGFIFLTSINLYLALIIIPLGLVTSFCSKKIENYTEKNVALQKETTEKNWKLFSEGIQGINNIKVFDEHGNYLKKIKKVSGELCNINVKQSKIQNFGGGIIGTLYMMTIAVIMLVSAIFVLNGSLSFGGLLAIVMYNHMLVDPLLNIIEARQKLIRLNISVARIEQILKMEKLKKEKKDIAVNKVSFENVSFSYGDKSVIENFNYVFEKGKSYCLEGKTGTGKTTILNLLVGYLTPDNGKIKIVSDDDSEYENIILNRVSYMLQNGYLFNATIEENIKFANPKISDEEMDELLTKCCLLEVKERVGKEIGNDGNRLSGGERKRVQLAVCLAKKDCEVYVFDELSSALDKNTFDAIKNNIQEYLKNKIAIFVEHYNIEKELYDDVIRLC